ncbi:MAG: T9SS type A sorting domain-containing protein, partial [Chloroflexi bacterium]|nr:T9SS type A sorting domain-containing protein [Chloroflexota bacterium]
IPSQSQLFQNYPNPFNPETWIPFQLAESAEVTIRIYNVAGQLVRTLNLGQKTAGRYLDKTRAAYWDGRNEQNEKISSGVYFYLIEAGNFRATKKLVVAK